MFSNLNYNCFNVLDPVMLLAGGQGGLNVSKSRKQILKFSFEPKITLTILVPRIASWDT